MVKATNQRYLVINRKLTLKEFYNIEFFFKIIKSLLRLRKEFQGVSYDLMISHTTIVFTRYVVL